MKNNNNLLKRLFSLTLCGVLLFSTPFSLSFAEENTANTQAESTIQVISAEPVGEVFSEDVVDSELWESPFTVLSLLAVGEDVYFTSTQGFGVWNEKERKPHILNKEANADYMFTLNGNIILGGFSRLFTAYDPKTQTFSPFDYSFHLQSEDDSVSTVLNASKAPIILVRDTNGFPYLKWTDDGTVQDLSELDVASVALKNDDEVFVKTSQGLYLVSKTQIEEVKPKEKGLYSGFFDIFYNKQADEVQFLEGNFINAFTKEGEYKEVAYVPIAPTRNGVNLNDSILAYISNSENEEDEQISIVHLNAMPKMDDVVVVSGLSSDMANRYNAQNPDRPLATWGYVNSTLYRDTAQLAVRMKQKEAADIYILSALGTGKTLAEKGYVESLDSNATLMQNNALLYPFVQQGVSLNSKPYAVPLGLDPINAGFAVFKDNVESLGIDPNINTLEAFADALQKGDEAIAGTSYKLIYQGDFIKQRLVSKALLSHYATALRKGEEPKFNTPDMVALLSKLQGLNLKSLENENETFYSLDDANHALFEEYIGMRPMRIESISPSTPLYLSNAKGEDPISIYTTQYAMVNSFSPKKDKAFKVLERLTSIITPENRFYLYENDNAPVEDPAQMKEVQKLEKYLQLKEQDLAEETDEHAKKHIEETIAATKDDIARAKTQSYIISPEMVENYNAHISQMYVLQTRFVDERNEQQMTLMDRFFAGDIDAQNFLNEFDRIVQMSKMEDGN